LILALSAPAFAASAGRRERLPDFDEHSEASPHAYVADNMELKRKMPTRPEWRQQNFYFKHCREVGRRFYISKTAYECSADLYP
jgi:hypothetical protein